jgi:hypothetical protein
MAVVFFWLGHVSDEPLDHPQWLMAGYWPVLVCYTVLAGFCLPCLCLYGLLLYALRLWGLIAGPDPYNPLGQWSFVTYPLMQGALYGGAAWILVLVGSTVRAIFSGREPRGLLRDSGSGKAATCARKYRRLLATVALIVIASIASRSVLLPTLPSTWRADFDWNRYVEIYAAIKADQHHMLGKSFDEVSKRFGLGCVPWDDAFEQGLASDQTGRIYHFQGFALYVTVGRELPEDSPLRKRGWYTEEDLQRYGVLRLANQFPFVRADGINDRGERMKTLFGCDRRRVRAD